MTEPFIAEQKAWTNLFKEIKKQQVILTASICLVALVIVLKNVLLVPTAFLMRDSVIYIVIYLSFIFVSFKTDDTEETSERINPLFWDVLVVLITIAIIAVYAW